MKAISSFIFFVTFISSIGLQAQQSASFAINTSTNSVLLQSFSLPSPNAASLGKYGNLGANQFSGNLDFSIPIYTIKSRGIELPITLSYSNNGLKVAEEDSYVGHGWTLLAGGVITRAVRGIPDGVQQLLDVTKFPMPWSYSNTSVGAYQYINTSSMNGQIDPEPDLYMLRAGNLSLQFFYDNFGRIQTVPYNNGIRIIFDGTTYTVVDEEGNTYLFGSAKDNEVSVSINNGISFTSAWYLTKITTAIGGVITFQDSLGATSIVQDQYTETEEINPNGQLAQCNVFGPETRMINFTAFSIRPVFLKSITTDKEIVYFNRESDTRADLPNDTALKEIRVYSRLTGTYDYNFSFVHSYFPQVSTICWGDGQTPNHPHNHTAVCRRLRLDQFVDKGNNINAPYGKTYSFTYSPKSTPSRCSRDQDFWGYYNAAGNNSSMLPNVDADDPDFRPYLKAASREANPSVADAGMLQKIIYPTGGQTEITYEPNVYPTIVTDPGYTTVPVGLSPINPTLMASTTFTILYTQPVLVNFALTDNNQPDQGLQRKVEILDPNGQVVFTSINSNSPTNGTVVYGRSVVAPFSNGLTPGTYTLKISRNYDPTGQPSAPAISASVTFRGNTTSTVVNRTIGGFRVRKIVDKTDATGSEINVKEFAYDNAFLIANIQSADCISTYKRATQQNSQNYECNAKSRSVTSIRPVGTVQGSHIGYGRVTVFQGDNGSKGRTEYNYSLEPDEGGYSLNPVYRPISSHDYKRGLLLSSYVYDANGALKKSMVNEYENIPKYVAAFHIPYYIRDEPPIGITYPSGLPYKEFAFTDYLIFSEWVRVKMKAETTFDPAGYISTVTQFSYDNPNSSLTTETKITNSKGDNISKTVKHPMDYKPASAQSKEEIERQFDANVILKFNQFQSCSSSSNGDATALDGCYTTYASDITNLKTTRNTALAAYASTFINLANATSDPVLKGYYQLIAKNKLGAETELRLVKNQTQEQAKVNTIYKDFGTGLMLPQAISTSFNGAALENEATFDIYGANGNLWQKTPKNGITESYAYDYASNFPVGQAVNAQYSDIAYISFEDIGKGNWTFNGTPQKDATAVTGNKSYELSTGSLTKSVTSSTTYYVTYWRPTNLSALSIAGTIPGYPIAGRTVNGWKYFEHKVTGQTTITLAGSGKIDEVRLYPVNSQLFTCTYDPLKGVTSKCDANNNITYFSYDGLNRLVLIRDQDRNVLKRYCYTYSGQPDACTIYSNVAQSQTYTRSNCSSCQIGGYVTYTVPAGQYYSTLSSSDADQQALNEVYANGQKNADQYGTCTTPTTVQCLASNLVSNQSFSVQFYNPCLNTSIGYTIASGTTNVALSGLKQGVYNVTFNAVGGGGSSLFTYSIDGYGMRANNGVVYSVPITSSSNTLIIRP